MSPMPRVLALAVLASCATGCVASVDFDPIGGDATVEGSWSIAGAPASAETCGAASITHVRVRFFDEADPESFRDHPDLVFECAAGAFDTRPEPVLKGGSWRVRLLALNNAVPPGEDNTVAAGPIATADTSTGHVVLPLADFAP